jgi:5-methylcytosine-specific restriction endonuclease McrA
VVRIESIINTDKKTATYKLALLRACCDIAQRESGRVSWHPDGRVRLPITSLVERWTEYYWPLMASPDFVPQNQGEEPSSAKPISFRRNLSDLAQLYRPRGGYSTFAEDLRSASMSGGESDLWKNTRSDIRNAIIKGPVYYAKGATDGSRPFEYEKETKSVLLSAELWREFSLLGHWIRDSLLLRWAEETDRMSHGQVSVGSALALLLSDIQPERDQNRVRTIYLGKPGLECVWSGKTLKQKNLHIDHAIPFSLWRDNSLWNLLPADEKVNTNKRDKLPTEHLMNFRRDAVIQSWRTISDMQPVRFAAEASSLLGRNPGQNWEAALFLAFLEAVEVTAARRGVERWEPA